MTQPEPGDSLDTNRTEAAAPDPLSRAGGGASRFSSSGLLLGIAIVAMAGALILLGQGSPAPLRRGDPAPAFSLPRLDGDGAMSLADLRGQVVLVNFWATWCKPCEDEMPAMERLYGQLHGRGFELVAISVDEIPADVEPFVARMGLSFPVLLDSDQATSRSYQTMGYPESLLLDREGTIVERYVGPKPWDGPGYIARVERLLEAQ